MQNNIKNIEIKKIIRNVLWAFLATFGVVHFLNIGFELRNFSNNIIYVFLSVFTFLCLLKMQKVAQKKEYIYSSVFSVLISCCLVIGAQIEYLNKMLWNIKTVFSIIFLALFWVPIVSIVLSFFKDYKLPKFNKKIKFTKSFVFLLVAGIWFVGYLALYPGIYDYDSIDQTLQFLVTNRISGHHPVLHSFILSSFLSFGKNLFDSYQIGLGAYSLLQMLFLAFIATKIIWFFKQQNQNILFYISLIFFMFFPLHYIMSVWATKDIFFTAFFAWFSLENIYFFENKEDYFRKKANIFKYLLIILFMCLFRNNGIYALFLALPFFVLCFKKVSFKLVITSIAAISIYLVIQNIVFPALNVIPGNKREMMSIPCQQLAKVYVERPEVFTEEEKTYLFELIPEENLKNYELTPMISDSTKNYFNTELFNENKIKFVKFYVSVGLRSPRKYVEAFLANSLGFWYPNKSYYDSRLYHPYTEFNMADPNLYKGDYIYIERSSKFPLYEKVLKKIILDTEWTNVPIISNMFVPGTYFVLLCLCWLISLYKKQKKKYPLLMFWSAYWLTLIVSPVALVRYAYPVIFCLPMILYLFFDLITSKVSTGDGKFMDDAKNINTNNLILED